MDRKHTDRLKCQITQVGKTRKNFLGNFVVKISVSITLYNIMRRWLIINSALPNHLCKKWQIGESALYFQQATLLSFIRRNEYRGWMNKAARQFKTAYSPYPYSSYFTCQLFCYN